MATGQINRVIDQVREAILAEGPHGLSDEQLQHARLGEADDRRTDAVLRFARQVLGSRGHVSDGELQAFRDAGYDDGAVAEVVANVALNILTNYFNNVAETDIDFPKAAELQAVGA